MSGKSLFALITIILSSYGTAQNVPDQYSNQVKCPRHNPTGQFPYPLDFSLFINCWQGQAFLQQCGTGSLFNPRLLVCDWPNNVLNEYTQGAEVKCPSPYVSGYFPFSLHYHLFINCWQGQAFLQECGTGTIFNPRTLLCDLPSNVFSK